MSQSVNDTQVIKFSIALAGVRLSRAERNELEELVTGYIHTLIKDLDIPAKFALWLRVSEADSKASPLRVYIHGKKCRVPLWPSIGDGGIKPLASRIMVIIHQNRDLLVNRAITNLIRETYIHEANEGLRNLEYGEFHQLVVTLVKRGYSLHRLRGPGPGSDTRAWTHLHHFDSLIESADTPTVRVTYSTAYFRHAFFLLGARELTAQQRPELRPALQQRPELRPAFMKFLRSLSVWFPAPLRRRVASKTDFTRLIEQLAPESRKDISSIGESLNRITMSMQESLNEMSSSMQEDLFDSLGIAFPRVVWEGESDGSLGADVFQIRLNDVSHPAAFGPRRNEVLVDATADRLALLDVEGRPAINPANQAESAIVDVGSANVCEHAGLTSLDPLRYSVLYLSRQLRQEAGSFLTKDVVENNLFTVRQAFPVLVHAFLDRYDLFKLTWILRDLLDEELSIRDLRSILVNLLLIQGTIPEDLVKDAVVYPEGTHLVATSRATLCDLRSADYADYIRTTALKRHISHKYARGGSSLKVYLLAPELEDRIRVSKGRKLSEAERNEILEAVSSEVPPAAQNPVILTTMDVRRPFRELIEVEFPQLAVLCHQELSPELRIEPIATIVA